MIKNPYQKDYQNELKQNRHGLLVTRTSYQGDFYVLPFDEQQKRRTGILNVIWTIALWVIELGMKRSCIGAMVLTGIGAVLDLVYMVLHRGGIRMGIECIYLIGHFLFLAVAFSFGKYYDRNYSGILIENATME